MRTAMPGPTSHAYFSQRLRLHYVDWGNPEAPLMLLVHGGRDHCRNWDWVAQALRDEYHVIAPDLRGHGDSQWMIGGAYTLSDYVYDLAQLITQMDRGPVTIIAHSLGGMISLRYAGIYPQSVQKLAVIEGLGWSPKRSVELAARAPEVAMGDWISGLRKISGRVPRRYPSLEDAFARMHEENPHLSPAQAHHLTVHGVNRNEDGTYSWKFDNYVRVWPPYDIPDGHVIALWGRITCPVLLVRGTESQASDPEADGRIRHFRNARLFNIDGAGHWCHHDRLDRFVEEVRRFLAE